MFTLLWLLAGFGTVRLRFCVRRLVGAVWGGCEQLRVTSGRISALQRRSVTVGRLQPSFILPRLCKHFVDNRDAPDWILTDQNMDCWRFIVLQLLAFVIVNTQCSIECPSALSRQRLKPPQLRITEKLRRKILMSDNRVLTVLAL